MISKSVEETKNIARDFAKNLRQNPLGATLVALSGDLGSGKTTLTKAFAETFGISPSEVTSPTFVIMKSYDLSGNTNGFKKFIHIDAYRLESAEEMERLGWRELLEDPGNLILIEWPENIGTAMPQNVAKISLKFIDENTREIVFN